MAIDLANTGVYADTDRCDESRLAEVGTEARPKVVVQVRSPVKRAGVQRQPMSYDIEERNQQGDSHHEKQEDNPDYWPPRTAAASTGVDFSSAAGSS
jgi:hypothetical protein